MITKPLLSLVGVFKNEASNIRSVLESAKPYIQSWCLLDTGSDDGTQDIIRETLKDIPGTLHEVPWEGYAGSRNKALELAKDSADFALMVSGDETLVNGQALVDYLETQRSADADAFKIKLSLDDTTLYPPRIFRTGSPWHYVDDDCGVHEYPTHPDPNAQLGIVPAASIEHTVSDPERRYANIWENHIPLLEGKLEENPNNERALIFLASSYESLLPMMPKEEQITVAMKVMSLYMRRLAIPTGSEAERNFLKMRLLYNAKNTMIYNEHEFFSRCDELCKVDPHRPETALLRLNASMSCVPVSQVYDLAVDTARVAKEAASLVNDSPVSASCEWKAHLIAAKAAKQLAIKYDSDDWWIKTTQHVNRGIASGGPADYFDGLIT